MTPGCFLLFGVLWAASEASRPFCDILRRHMQKKQILIVGGGFGGVETALRLSRKNISNVEITLLSQNPYLLYYPSLYSLALESDERRSIIPLSDIFAKKDVLLMTDTVTSLDSSKKIVMGSSGMVYPYDMLVLALGAETTYFGLPGLDTLSYGFKSLPESRKLRSHIDSLFDIEKITALSEEEKKNHFHTVIVGGGPSGIEMAGALIENLRTRLTQASLDASLAQVTIVEGSPRLMPVVAEKVSARILARLQKIGVNVLLNKRLEKQELNNVCMNDMTLCADTVIWTAGSKTNSFYATIPGVTFSPRKKVVVDAKTLEVVGVPDVYVIGDAAETTYSGLAQTAITDGIFLANYFKAKLSNQKLPEYVSIKKAYATPVDSRFGVVAYGPVAVFGWPARIFRDLVDIHYFWHVLPFKTFLKWLFR